MNPGSPVLRALARLYAESKAGRTGQGERDFLVDFKKLLKAAHCEDGDDRDAAIRDLRALDGQLLHLEGPRRDDDIIHRVRMPLANEARLFAFVRELSPAEQRQALARQFSEAARVEVPECWREAWQKFCGELAEAALVGGPISSFNREDPAGNAELLALVPKLLAWHEQNEESLLRFASCVLTSDSKRLGELAARGFAGQMRGKLGKILERLTDGKIQCLEDVGILQTLRFVLIHGPLRLLLDNTWLDLGMLQGPVYLSETDITRAAQIETSARRCLTVENETSFHELAKLHSGELLICTSYPGSATLAFLQKLPDTLEFWHFGDSDPEGFDILRDLRVRSGRPFRAVHMDWRPAQHYPPLEPAEGRLLKKLLSLPIMQAEHEVLNTILTKSCKGAFEQESLGLPKQRGWPFY